MPESPSIPGLGRATHSSQISVAVVSTTEAHWARDRGVNQNAIYERGSLDIMEMAG